MKVTWNEYPTFPDGTQSYWVEGVFIINDKKYTLDIKDHTRESAKKDDYEVKRHVPFAYDVRGFKAFDTNSFLKFGLNPYGLCDAGIDENIGYNDGTSKYRFTGKAAHTIKDVEKLVELAVIDSFQFDYEAELAAAKARLDARRKIMDDVNEYKSSLGIEEEIS